MRRSDVRDKMGCLKLYILFLFLVSGLGTEYLIAKQTYQNFQKGLMLQSHLNKIKPINCKVEQFESISHENDSLPEAAKKRFWYIHLGHRLTFSKDRSASFGNYLNMGLKLSSAIEVGLSLGHSDLNLFPDTRVYPIYFHTFWTPGRFKIKPVFSLAIGTNLIKAPENFYFWDQPQSSADNGWYGHAETGVSYNFARGERIRFLFGLQFHQFAVRYKFNESYAETYKHKLTNFYISISLGI